MRWRLSLITLGVMAAAGMMAPSGPTELRRVSTVADVAPDAAADPEPATEVRWTAGILDEADRTRYRSDVSASEAVRIALARGEELAAARGAGAPEGEPPAPPAVEAPAPAADPAPQEEVAVADPASIDDDAWRVTADRVNLRSGPGTDTDVVGSVTEGERLVPLRGIGTDWIEVRRSSGETAWIYAEFLARGEG